MSKRADYAWRPLLMVAGEAHQNGWVSYEKSGAVIVQHEALPEARQVPVGAQYPCILPTFLALDKALSSSSNSPRLRGGSSLREAFDREYRTYLGLLEQGQTGAGSWEPDFGTYVYDRKCNELYLVAPEYWHRLALVTSNAKLITDPAGALSSEEIRERLSSTVVGFVGASLGSNVIEGVVREMRPRAAKVADPDYLEATNLNRLQHGSIRYLSQPRGNRVDLRNAFETRFVNKVDLIAYENQLVDPYMEWFLYPEGVTASNMEEFLLGGEGEPRVDYVVEEADDIRIKIEVRKFARKHGIPVFMASDLGHQSQAQFQDFGTNSNASLGYKVSDDELLARLERCMASGQREDMFELARGLVGDDFIRDEYAQWILQRGEQPTNSIPQSGSVAQLSGALGGKLLTLHRLGHQLSERVMIDTRHLQMIVD